MNNSTEEDPISTGSFFYNNYHQHDFIRHVQVFAHKPGLLRTESEIQGVVLKGIGMDYDTSRFIPFIKEGTFPDVSGEDYSSEVVISTKISNMLALEVGDEVFMYFVQSPPRTRKLSIVGIYESGMEDIDDKMIVGDIRMIQRLNNWTDNQVGGFEVFVHNPDDSEALEYELFSIADSNHYVQSVEEKYFQIFDWLTLINRNVFIFLGLILFVACFNMVSIVLILIMERTQMIGLLKAMGAESKLVRKIFIYKGLVLTLKGLLWGNIIGIGFGALQYHLRFIPLDPENYYMTFVPIYWDWAIILMLNVLIFILVSASLIIPTTAIYKINPVKAIRFD